MVSTWITKRAYKETDVCSACGTCKMNAYFYDWYKHPAVSKLFKDTYNGKICLKCARRESGTKHQEGINE